MERRISTTNFLLIAAGVIALFAYSFLSYAAPQRANSPDENANRYFAELFAKEGKLWTYDPLQMIVPGVVHPRSTRVVDDAIVPGGFIGLPVIFGYLGRAFGIATLPFLMPLFGVLGAVAWGLIVARFFGRGAGRAAYLLLLVQPAWWYESGRVFMPNVLFVTLVLWAAYFFLVAPFAADAARRPQKKLYVSMVADGLIAGALLGLALAVRLAEAYWLVLGVLALAAAVRFRDLPWVRAALTVLIAAAVLLPFLNMNRTIYGNWLATGYAETFSEVPVAETVGGHAAALLGPARPYLFPLGLAPRLAWANFVTYGIGFFGWWSLLLAAALVYVAGAAWRAVKRHQSLSRPAAAAAVVTLVVTVWLTLFYGSWVIRDNPDPAAVSIGSSYLRYWLPLSVLWTLPLAWAAARAIESIRERQRSVWSVVAWAVALLLSGAAVFGAPQEGFLAMRSNLVRYDVQAKQILAATETNALIVVDRSDKLLFPDRSVIYPLRSDQTYTTLGRLAGQVPLYYFGISFPATDLAWLNETRLPPLGLFIEPVVDFGTETLYAFRPLNQTRK